MTPLMLGALCWAGFALTLWAVASGRTRGFDEAGLLLTRGQDLMPIGPRWMTGIAITLTELGGWKLRDLFLLAACALLLAGRRFRATLVVAATALGTPLANRFIKTLFDRPRPNIVPHLTAFETASFPSGHAMNSSATFLIIAMAIPAMTGRPALRRMLVAGALALSAGIAGSRVWLGVHYPTDVIAGLCAGTGLALFASWLLDRPEPVRAA